MMVPQREVAMILIKPSFEILACTDEPLKLIERAGRTCYKSEDKITEDSAGKFVEMVSKRGHLSVVEHANMTVRFMIDRGCCYSADTEVLTLQGWKLWEQVVNSDELACLSSDNVLEWHKPIRLYRYDYDGKLLAFQSQGVNLLVTPNHKMWVYDYDKRSSTSRTWRFIRADEMVNGRYMFQRAARWKGVRFKPVIPAHPTKRLQFPSIRPNDSCLFLTLLGLWVTDGSYRIGKDGGSCIQISQTKEHVRKEITRLCHELDFRISWQRKEARIDNLRLVRFVEGLFGPGAKTFTLRIPHAIKGSTLPEIEAFLRDVVLGDGNVHKKNNHTVIYTSSKRFADDLQELYMKIGLSVNVRTIPPRKRGSILGRKVRNTHVSYVVSVHGKKRSFPLLVRRSAKAMGKPIPYKGAVYCAEVPGNRLYVRRQGVPVWCGNSHELVRHRLAAYSQESTRYANYSKERFGGQITFVIPPWITTEPGEYLLGESVAKLGLDVPSLAWIQALANCEMAYLSLLNLGWKPEQARSVLPNSLKTEIVATMNFRQWLHVFDLHCSPAAHPQMREIMIPLRDECRRRWPAVFGKP
jgi:flavin-dependent thymidylate synthase